MAAVSRKPRQCCEEGVHMTLVHSDDHGRSMSVCMAPAPDDGFFTGSDGVRVCGRRHFRMRCKSVLQEGRVAFGEPT